MKNFLTIFALFFLINGCNQNEAPSENSPNIEEFYISNGWLRPANAGMMTAAYFTIHNNYSVADTLLSVSTQSAVDSQIHESFAGEDGIMGMREIGMVPIEANSNAELKPGGIHIMVIRPQNDITEGDSVDFVLQFSKLGSLDIRLPVQLSEN